MTRFGDPSDEWMQRKMAEAHGLQYIDFDEVSLSPTVVNLLPEAVARKFGAIPLVETEGKLTIVVSDPNDYDTFDALRFTLNRQIEIALATKKSIERAIDRCYSLPTNGI